MKITIEDVSPETEDEIIIRCRELDDELMQLIYALKSGRTKLTAYSDDGIIQLSPKDIYYFESVDNKVFACCEKSVYEVRLKLYEIEKMYERSDFMRISKSMIADVSKISRIIPSFNSRMEAVMKNGEKVIISRQYVSDLKKKLEL
ncbi:MAG: LytTR family transcriptional regulator DNA-binding domain-containing protein [Oscillospiraceae bacterium]|nr:LytTR family transcriptional regulator DNA-binding domain-containing protein [Oscillospiraceae bacterium]